MNNDWHDISLLNIDTPALIVDKVKVGFNIAKAIEIAGGTPRLRPHVKTHKMLEAASLQINAGINKFKCATIAEAEMLAMAGAEDVLIAYPVQGPMTARVAALVSAFPGTIFSVLVDNLLSAHEINQQFTLQGLVIDVFIDINNGQDRTGIKVEDALDLALFILSLGNIKLKGLHCYDGHINMSSYEYREEKCKEAFLPVLKLSEILNSGYNLNLTIVAGGSPTFPVHASCHPVECSPGTFIFWDEGYASKYKEQSFIKAVVVATRIISKIDPQTYCLDLGYKSVASESPLPRVKFINNQDIEQIGHSEEHLVIRTNSKSTFKVGEVLLAYPFHICPTVALYDHVNVISFGKYIGQWDVTARNRKITI